jgi:hypothetical protein
MCVACDRVCEQKAELAALKLGLSTTPLHYRVMLHSAFTVGSQLSVKVRGGLTVDVWLCAVSEAERAAELLRHNTERYVRATDVLARGFTMQVCAVCVRYNLSVRIFDVSLFWVLRNFSLAVACSTEEATPVPASCI